VRELEVDDRHWAEDFGARWGANYPHLHESNQELSRAFREAADEPLNERAIAHQKRVLGIPPEIELNTAQAAAAVPYLSALADAMLREMQWALWWRRQRVARGEVDSGVDYMVLRAEPNFRSYLERYGPSTAGRVLVVGEDGSAFYNSSVSAGVSEHPTQGAGERLSFRERRAQRKAQKLAAEAYKQDLAQQEARQAALRRHAALSEQARVRHEQQEILRRRPPAPPPQPYGVNHQGAERFVADWMRHLGVRDATVTQYSGDGGIDVESRHVIAQVKNLHHAATVPVAHIRDLLGTATQRKKAAVLFTSGVISQSGLAFAESTGIALIRYDAEKGQLSGLNPRGRQAITSGFPATFGFNE